MTKGTKGTQRQASPRTSKSLKSLGSFPSLSSLPARFIPPHGGYEQLLAYQKALVVFDATVYFCDRFIAYGDRTRDQMIQAARSGKQNILEGSEASGTSKEAELKLTGVAKASQQELLEDYRDFMRLRRIVEWESDHPYALRLRRLNRTPAPTTKPLRKVLSTPTRPFAPT